MFQVKKKISPTSIKMFVRNEDSTESFLCYGTVKILETCFFFFSFLQEKNYFKHLCFKQLWWVFKLCVTSILKTTGIKQRDEYIAMSVHLSIMKKQTTIFKHLLQRKLVFENSFKKIF